MTVKELKKNDWFTKKPIDEPRESQVWIRGEYDRSTKKYVCTRFDDICTTCLIRGDKEIYTDFTF